jgi:ferredoxin
VGCGLCAKACPKGLIEIVPASSYVAVQCSNKDRGPQVKKVCSAGCIGCMLCTKQCESDAIHVENNLARIDYEKCTQCGKCAAKCPVKVILPPAGSSAVQIEESQTEVPPHEGKKVILKNSVGLTKKVKVGFSWTGLLFGIFVPMVRGDWRGFFIWLMVDIVTAGLGWLVFPFVYNKTYIRRLIEKRGYLPASASEMMYLNLKGISVSKTAHEAKED